MTETAGPQGGPPPSAGRGPWSEAFKRRRGWGEVLKRGVNTAVGSDTHRRQVEFESKHLIEHFVRQSQNHCNDSECEETEMKAVY